MDDQTSTQILQAITSLTRTVEQYHGDFREFRGSVTTQLESMTVADKATDKRADNDRMWMKIQAVCVVPVMGLLHQIAVHFGWIH